MKRIPAMFAALAFLAIASASASAQPRPTTTPVRQAPQATPSRPATTTAAPAVTAPVPSTKIALVNTQMFGDEKNGIKRFLTAVKTVENEFRPKQTELQGIQTRIKGIADEISKLSGAAVVDPKTIQAKQDEGERMQRDLKYKKEQFDADVERRYKELVGPVTNDIGKALDQFAAQNGLTMILDISKLLPAVLTINPASDVTAQFIADFNSKNP